MKTLVTGGNGAIGRVVVAALLDAGHEVVVFDAQQPEKPVTDCIEGSITEPASIARAVEGCAAVVHLAAIPAYKPGLAAADYMHVNVTGTANVLEAAGQCGVSRFVMASSDSTLGFVFATHAFAPDYFPLDEDHPLRPQDPYGLSKLLGEELCRAAAHRYGLQAVCLRFCWVWFEETYAQRAQILKGDPNTLAKTMWGYVDVRDAAQACRLAIERPGPLPHDVFFIAAADTYSDQPSLELIRNHYPQVSRVGAALLDAPHRSLFDIQRAQKFLGYTPQHAWRDTAPARPLS